MYLRTICPSCGEAYELTQQQRGHKVVCPECRTLFAPEVEEVAEDGDKLAAASKPRDKRRKRADRPRKLRPRGGPMKWVILAVIGLCVLAVLVVATALLVYLLRSK